MRAAIAEAAEADIGFVMATLGTALSRGPLAAWIRPALVGRLVADLAYAEVLFCEAMADEAAEIDVLSGPAGVLSERCVGVAIWRTYPSPFPRAPRGPHRVARLIEALGTEAYGRLAMLTAMTAAAHAPGFYDELTCLAVRPAYQNQGLGTRLLQHRHAQLDAAGTAAFVVATSRGAHNLYQRHGYTVLQRLSLPDAGPAFWTMLRQPPDPAETTDPPPQRRPPLRHPSHV